MEKRVECQEVIITTCEQRGDGKDRSLLRGLRRVYTKDGVLIAEYDPVGNFTMEDLYDFEKHIAEGGNVEQFMDLARKRRLYNFL